MLTWVLIAAAVVAVVVKRFMGEPLNARDLFGPPLVLFGIGVYELIKTSLTLVDVLWLAAGSVVGLVLGVLRGTTITLFVRDDVLWQRYTPWTVAVWAGSLAVNFGLGLAATSAGMHAEARPMTLSIGVGLLGELVPVGLRAIRSGVPFAPQRR
ncbi:DUF1453 family protein [Actinosynnema sp. NPDC047251]|uniref:Uncharacterized protein n=1 Tax=Saccharothrix espanaensis (strain ATCC 51144 / DSM 44229 / JCM 9112 / NBRC 15066 / NRRL 15764) TaxID=1179773 RepID=K0K123_SACES|nr:DUF1453 family protein [Saccharothrix espanaensis]CCH33935.1 hypothetical protein BN6_66980 [Saccharothrix espanaensis DSM 44229]